MAKHEIITNRPVRVKNGVEQMDESNPAATHPLRFGTQAHLPNVFFINLQSC